MLEAGILALFGLTLYAWFGGKPGWLPPGVPLAALGLAAAARLWEANLRPPRPSLETSACVALAVVYRMSALVHPWGWVNKDGAYGGFVALHLLEGLRPAPAFTEGANYQGTLKSHIAALLSLATGAGDLSLLMTAASLLLYLVFLAATMAVARRVGGRGAALAAGLYLALGPRFLTVFSLNCVGQYVDVLALGGLALAVLARLLEQGISGAAARGEYAALGLLLGAAFWQQPVALSYVCVAFLTLSLRRETWRDPWALLAPGGLVLGLLPVLLWNLQNDWATRDIVGRDAAELRAQAEALPHLVHSTATISFPILAGLSRNHPWEDVPGIRPIMVALLPALLVGYLLLRGRETLASVRTTRPTLALLPPLLMTSCVLIFWAVAQGKVYWRPRYLLPVMAASAVHLGVIAAWSWSRSRAATVLGLGLLVALNLAGTWPRMLAAGRIADEYLGVVRSLDDKGIRTGYADFSLSAPVTMFTAERIVLSSRLGPTPAYESDRHTLRVQRDGPDAYVLPPRDDPDRFASVLRGLGVGFRVDLEPVPVFFGFSRRVRLEEVAGFREGQEPPEPAEE